jgi:hypothetical protein
MANDGKYLSAEQILAFAQPGQFVTDPSDDERVPCGYCGALTKMHGYTDTATGDHWPACCSNGDCIYKWEPDKRGASR